jgi:hypothetical protein
MILRFVAVPVSLSTPVLLSPSKIFTQGAKKFFPCYSIFSAINNVIKALDLILEKYVAEI